MPEKIGLQAVLEDEQFRKGLKNYIDGIDKMEKGNKEMSEAAKKSGKSLDNLSDDMKEGGQSALDLAAQMVVVKQAMGVVQELAGKGLELAKLGATAERVEERFGKFAEAAGGAEEMLKAFQKGAGGAASEMDAMLASSKLLQMGLVTDAESMEVTVELATRLGDQTASVTSRVEDFALMLANQSIPRLDNFGISSGDVRARMAELMDSVEGMTRETAFMTATMEIGGESLAILGERTEDTAMTFEIMEARMADAKVELGKKFAPVAGAVFDVLGGLGDEVLMVGAAFGEFGGALVQAGPLLNAMVPSLKGLLPMFQKLPSAIKAMNLGLNASTLAMGGVMAAIPLIIIGVGKLKGAIDDYNAEIEEATRLAREWDTAIAEQIQAGKSLEDIIRERIRVIKEERVALQQRSDLEVWFNDEVLLKSKDRRREIIIQSQSLTESLIAEGIGFEAANAYVQQWNQGMVDGVGIIPEFTEETYLAGVTVQEVAGYLDGYTGSMWDVFDAMLIGEQATFELENSYYDLAQQLGHTNLALEDGSLAMMLYETEEEQMIRLTKESADALELQEQAIKDVEAAHEEAIRVAEEEARVQEELAIAHQKVIDAIIREKQSYYNLAEQMKGIDEEGHMRLVLAEINRLEEEGISVGEQASVARRRLGEDMGWTTDKSWFLAEGMNAITKAAEEERLGNWTLVGANQALRDSWDQGARSVVLWLEQAGLAAPTLDNAASAARLYGIATDGVGKAIDPVTEKTDSLAEKIERMATATGETVAPLGDARDVVDSLAEKVERMATATGETVAPLGDARDVVDSLAEKVERMATATGESVVPLGEAETAAGGLAEKVERMATATGESVEPLGDARDAADGLAEKVERMATATGESVAPLEEATEGADFWAAAADKAILPTGDLTTKVDDLTTATGESVGPLGDAEAAVDTFAESTLEAQEPVDELLARFELLPDQILTLAPQMRKAGESLVGAFRVGFEGAFEALEEEKVKRLKIFREEFHSSRDPKDKSSPLMGFYESGQALVQSYMDGLESMWPKLGHTLDNLFEIGRSFGGLGGIAGGILQKNIREMTDSQKDIDAELKQIFDMLGIEGTARGGLETYNAIIASLGGHKRITTLQIMRQRGDELTKKQEYDLRLNEWAVDLMRERNDLTEEQIRLQEKLARMEEQQTRLRFLEQQVALLKMIEQHGLDAGDILDGLQLGADASAEKVLEAMTRAMEEVVRQAEERLGIESPSKVFFKIGQQTMAGMAMGIQDLASLPVQQSVIASRSVASAPAMAGRDYNVTNSSRRVTVNSGGNVFNTGMDETGFSARTTRDVSRAMRGQ